MFFGLVFDGVKVAAGEKTQRKNTKERKKNSARKPKAEIFKNHMRWTINFASSLKNPLFGEKYA